MNPAAFAPPIVAGESAFMVHGQGVYLSLGGQPELAI
jgi:hypothetical protein